MQLAILFWFYKEPHICKQRIELIRETNPDAKIYGLYGGDPHQENVFRNELGPLVDDFYTSSFCDKESEFKWIHGDVLLLDWYEKRGVELSWDSVAVVQWDMLLFDSLGAIFPGLEKDQMYLSGFRKLDADLEKRWYWTAQENEAERSDFETFKKVVASEYGYAPDEFPCCLFVFQILPRNFFKKWLQVADKYVGMLEYKIPAYAEIFSIKMYQKDIGVYWGDPKEDASAMPVNALPEEIKAAYVQSELSQTNGYRMFHPYSKSWE